MGRATESPRARYRHPRPCPARHGANRIGLRTADSSGGGGGRCTPGSNRRRAGQRGVCQRRRAVGEPELLRRGPHPSGPGADLQPSGVGPPVHAPLRASRHRRLQSGQLAGGGRLQPAHVLLAPNESARRTLRGAPVAQEHLRAGCLWPGHRYEPHAGGQFVHEREVPSRAQSSVGSRGHPLRDLSRVRARRHRGSVRRHLALAGRRVLQSGRDRRTLQPGQRIPRSRGP